jgi:formylglycine-generating enzyme required for sulfatase activity
VVDVSWDDVQEFCTWLSRTDGKTYRLPTEAEWEYACRAGTTTAWYNGDTLADVVQIGNSADKSAKAKFSVWRTTSASDGFVYTSPVGQFRPNNFGLYDTIGNVLEWCSDFFDSRYYQNSPDADPTGPRGGKRHVARGGAFTSIGEAASRIDLATNHRAPDVGFRVVCEIPAVPRIGARPFRSSRGTRSISSIKSRRHRSTPS